MSLVYQQTDFLHAWVWAMIHSVWIGLLLALVYSAYLSINHSATAHNKYKVGRTLFLLLPIGSLLAFIACLPGKPDLSGSKIINVGGAAALNAIQNAAGELSSNTSFGMTIGHYIPSIFGIWCLGVILLSLRMIAGYREISMLRKQSSPIDNTGLNSVFEQLIVKAGLKKAIQLASSTQIDIPITLGHLRPIVLLPVSIVNQLSLEETYAILAHELAHILRRDYLQNLLISTTEILFFFHPSVWWYTSTIKSIREQCCDDIALSLGAERMALSKALITLEDQHSAPLFAMAFSHKNQLLHRIQRLFDIRTTNEFTMSRGQAPLLICSITIFWMLTSAWHPVSDLIAKADNLIPLSKSFLWDTKSPADTTKPNPNPNASKIEKITKDNGKQKLELSLDDKKIKELKVDDKIIPPKEYDKYKAETEALTQELKEIEMPDKSFRAPVYRDYTPGYSGAYSYSYNFEDGVDDRAPSPEYLKQERQYSRNYNTPNADRRPHAYSWSGDEPIRPRTKIREFPFSSGDKIKYIIEGDSTGLIIDGDKLILKNEKGDVIIDFKDDRGRNWSRTPRAFSFSPGEFEPRGFDKQFKELHNLKDLRSDMKEEMMKQKWNSEEFRKKWNDEMEKSGKWNDEMQEKLKMELDRSNELIDKELFKNKELLDGQHLKHLKELHELSGDNLSKEWGDRRFFKDGEGFNLLSGKGKLDQIIREHLVLDKIIKPGESYEFKISATEMKVNGNKQNSQTYEVYKSILEDATGIQLKGNSNFVFSGTGKKE